MQFVPDDSCNTSPIGCRASPHPIMAKVPLMLIGAFSAGFGRKNTIIPQRSDIGLALVWSGHSSWGVRSVFLEASGRLGYRDKAGSLSGPGARSCSRTPASYLVQTSAPSAYQAACPPCPIVFGLSNNETCPSRDGALGVARHCYALVHSRVCVHHGAVAGFS